MLSPLVVTQFPIYWMEYDWIGDNIYFADVMGNMGLCSRRTLHCSGIIDGMGQYGRFIRPATALDPRRGYDPKNTDDCTMRWLLTAGAEKAIMVG